jgi:outer membrane protein assembly factor BamB
LKKWPEGGPKLLWTADEKLGAGYSSPAVTGDTIYTTGMFDGHGYVIALDLDGKLKWKVKYGPEWTSNFPAARTTPTIDGDSLYVMSGLGKIVCFSATDGKQIWAVDTVDTFGAKDITWGIAESVLIHGNLAICTPGGKDASLVALDKKTGRTIWRTEGLSDKSAYCSPIVIRKGKKHLVVTMTDSHIVGVGAVDGKPLWKHPYKGPYQAHINSPLYYQGQVYATSGYDAGGVMLGLSADGTEAKVLWTDKTLDVHHGGAVLVDGFIYGSNWQSNRDGTWVCLDWKTGEVKYDTRWVNKGQIIYADGMLYCYAEKGGDVALVKASPDEFKVVSSFKITQGNGYHWAHPAIAGGRLYIRHGDALMAYDIKQK